MKEFEIPMDPFSAPRISRRDAWKPTPAVSRYYGNRDLFRMEANKLGLSELPPAMGFIFHIPVSKSWNKGKKEAHIGQMHQLKPDLDNVIKAVLDCITYGRAKDDAHLGTIIFAQKLWTYESKGKILLYVPEDIRDQSRMKAVIDTIFSRIKALG